jgi:cholesterol transport system auxiliary component
MTRRLLLIALLAGIPLGCLSKSYPERQRYVLDPGRSELPHVAAAAGASGAGEAPMGALRVGRVRVSPLFERKRFVYRTGDFTFEEDFYNEFYAPPGQLLRQATSDWLNESPVFVAVVEDVPYAQPEWLLEGRVERLYADLRSGRTPRSVMVIEFTLLRSQNNEAVFARRYEAEPDIENRSPAAVVAGWNAGLAQILSEFERDAAATGRATR